MDSYLHGCWFECDDLDFKPRLNTYKDAWLGLFWILVSGVVGAGIVLAYLAWLHNFL